MSARVVCLVAAVSLGACSYNLDVLTSRRDGGADRPRTDAPAVDVPDVDRSVADAGPDSVVDDVPVRDAIVGACAITPMAALVDLATAPGVLRADGVTTFASTTMSPAETTGALQAPVGPCRDNQTPGSARVFRYVVRSGPRVVATTNTGTCGSPDTMLFPLWSCEAMGTSIRGNCNDDDDQNLCAACVGDAGIPTGCGTTLSTTEVGGLVAGDVVYFAVDGFGGARGPFRLSIAENGLKLVAPPAMGIVASHCTCLPPTTALHTMMVPFPVMTDTNRPLNVPNDSTLGGRPTLMVTTPVVGVSAQFRLAHANIRPPSDPACPNDTGSSATVDLYAFGRVVASVRVGQTVTAPSVVTIPFVSFAPITVPAEARTFEYRLRESMPTTGCATLEIDPTGPNFVTLYTL